LAYEHCRRLGSTPAGHGFCGDLITPSQDNYITEIMGVSRESRKPQRLVRLPVSASPASRARFLSFVVGLPDLSVRRAARNAIRISGPSRHQVRLVSSPIRFLTTQVPSPVGAIPNPIDGISDYKIPSDDRGQTTKPEHADTIGISYRFPAAPMCH